MNWVIYHVASGQVFFTGMAFLLLAAALGFHSKPWVQRTASVLWLLGIAAVIVSSTPLSYWYYVPAAVAAIFWRFVASAKRRNRKHLQIAATSLALAVVIGVMLELPFHFMPTIEAKNASSLVVFADSVTAGVGDKTETWPRLLARTKGVTIHDHSQMGATVASAWDVAKKTDIPRDSIVLLEIGGNDLLGTSTPQQFEADLDALLHLIAGRCQAVIMFELPLPPLSNERGRAQRRIAARHGVLLIPKRIFMRVLTPDEATLDTIHLTQEGQNLMADAVWNVIAPAFE